MGKRYNRIKKLVREDRTPYTGIRDFDGGWRKKILSESDWTPVTGSIANSSSQTFVHPTGATTTVSGLGGVETTPSTVTIDMDGERFDVPAPEYGQYGMQGYTPPLGNEVMKRNAAYQKELEEYRKKQDEQMRNIKSTLKSLGTSWEEMRANGWALIKDDGTSIMLTPTGSTTDMFNWTDNVQIQVGRPDPNAPFKPYKTVGSGGKNAVGYRHTDITIHSSILVKTIRLEIGDPPLPPSVNSQLDASQEFTQQVGADEFMKGRVTDTTKPAPEFTDTELTIDDFYSAADYSAFKAGGGNAAMKEKGQTPQQVIDQGKINLGQYDGGPRNPTPTGQSSPPVSDPYSIRDVNFRTSDKRSQAAARRRANRGPRSAPIPVLDYGANIARSIRANKPIRIPQSQIPQDEIDKLVQGLSNSYFLHNVPINRKEQPYSDEHIYELPNGEVRTHTADTKIKYGDNTMPVHSDRLGLVRSFGTSNPLAAAGKAQVQFVKPKKGEPYFVYTDHAYRNLTSTDPGEGSYNPVVRSADWVVHTVLGKNDPNKPNTGAMANHPSYIKGDVRKRIKVPYSKLPQNMKDRIDLRSRNFDDEDWTKVQESTTWSRINKYR